MSLKVKKPLTEKDAKDAETCFFVLSIGCLILAGVFVTYDGLQNKDPQPEDYFLAAMGMVALTLGLSLGNKIRLEILQKQFNDITQKK